MGAMSGRTNRTHWRYVRAGRPTIASGMTRTSPSTTVSARCQPLLHLLRWLTPSAACATVIDVTDPLSTFPDLGPTDLDEEARVAAEVTAEDLEEFDRFAARARRPISREAMFTALAQLADDGALPAAAVLRHPRAKAA